MGWQPEMMSWDNKWDDNMSKFHGMLTFDGTLMALNDNMGRQNEMIVLDDNMGWQH
jgi:hypothetical protein